MKRLLVVVGLTVTLLAPAAPAVALHHVPSLPNCGEGGAMATVHARAALSHNPAQDLPLPPVGTPADDPDTAPGVEGAPADGLGGSAHCP